MMSKSSHQDRLLFASTCRIIWAAVFLKISKQFGRAARRPVPPAAVRPLLHFPTTKERTMTMANDLTANYADPSNAIDQLNSLLRGEISAAETYRMAIDKISDNDAANGGFLRE